VDAASLELRIREARARCLAIASHRPTTLSSFEEYERAEAELLDLERQLALLKGEEVALPCAWPIAWDPGAPDPHVFSHQRRAVLLYWAAGAEKRWPIPPEDSKRTPDGPRSGKIAVVDFGLCYAVRFGGPNEEVFEGNPLFGKELKANRAHEVAHSRWLQQIEDINCCHANYRPEDWKRFRHFLLVFHDHTFECLAVEFTTEVREGTMRSVAVTVLDSLLA